MLSTIRKNLSKMAHATSFPLLQRLKTSQIGFGFDFNIEEKTRKRLSAFMAGTMLFSYLSIAPVEVLASGYDPYSFSSEDASDRGITSEPNSLKEKRLNEESLQRAKDLAEQEEKRKAQEQAQVRAQTGNNNQGDLEQKRQEAKLNASGAYSTLPNQQQNNTTATNPNAQETENSNNKDNGSKPSIQKYADEDKQGKNNTERVSMIINEGQPNQAIINPSVLSPDELRLFDSIEKTQVEDAFTMCYNHVKKTFTDEQAIIICKDSKNLLNFTYCVNSRGKETKIEFTNCYDTINVNVLKEQKHGEEQEEKSLCDKISFKPTEYVNENDTITYYAAEIAEAVFGFDDCVDLGITVGTTLLAFTGVGALAGAGRLLTKTGKISKMMTKLGNKAFPKADVLAIEGAETEEKLGRAKAVFERANKAGKKDAGDLLNTTRKMEKDIDFNTNKINNLENKLEKTEANLGKAESSLEKETNKMWDAYEANDAKKYEKAKEAFDKAYNKKYNLEDSLKKTTEQLDKTTDKLSANKAEAENFLEENRGKLKEYVVEETIRDSTTAKVFSATSSNAGKTIMIGTDIVAKGMHDYNGAISEVQGDPKAASYYSSQDQLDIVKTSKTQKEIENLTNQQNNLRNEMSNPDFNMRSNAMSKAREIEMQIQELQNSDDVKNQQYLDEVATKNRLNAQKGLMMNTKNKND